MPQNVFLIQYLKTDYSLPVNKFFCSLPVRHSHLANNDLPVFFKVSANWKRTIFLVMENDQRYLFNNIFFILAYSCSLSLTTMTIPFPSEQALFGGML